MGLDVAIEVKGTDLVSDEHLKGLRAFKEEILVNRFVSVSLDLNKLITSEGIKIIPVLESLDLLWKGNFSKVYI